MATPYRELFQAPGTKAFTLAGLIARVPLPMTGIGIITMLSQQYGSYALAGMVSATFVLTYALVSPQISRLVDQHGQRRVLRVATFISVTGLLTLISCSFYGAPYWSLFIGALLAGFMPSMSAMVRARWSWLYRGQPRLQAAYSLETVFDEVTFIVGPPLSVGLSVMVQPQAALVVAALILLLGASALSAQRATEPPAQPQESHEHSRSVIRMASVRLLTLLMVAMGVIVGTVDVVSVAFAQDLDRPAAASFVLSAYAIGSCVSGLVFGALQLKAPLHRQLLLGTLATTATTAPLMVVESIPSLAVAVLVAGLFFAPTMIVAMTSIERSVPEQNLTEGMTWLLAGLNVGVALGAAVSGQLVDEISARAGFYLSLSAGAAVLAIGLLAWMRLRADALTPSRQCDSTLSI